MREKKENLIGRWLMPALLLGVGICCWAIPQSSAASYNVTIDPGTTYQALEGFGAATAWYTGWITNHPNKTELYDVIFKDLGLDIIRFRNTYGSREGGSFAPDEAAILAGAKSSLGHDIKVLISSWTPPSTLKVDGKLNGGTMIKVNNAFPYSDFAQYWFDSLEAYAAKGIVPDYISIQNEPDYENTGWETCIFKPTETADYPGYGKALEAVYQKIQSLANVPKIIGPETAGMDNSLGNYTSNMNLSQVYGVAHHLYNGGYTDNPDSFVANMQKYKVLYSGKPIFETEYDQGTPLNTGLLILNALVEEGVSSYFYWDLIWEHGQRPLVELDNPGDKSSWWNNNGYITTEWYYVFKQFAKFTDPGYVRVKANSDASVIRTTAFLSEDRKQLSVILINSGSSESTVALKLGDYNVASSKIYRTIPGGTEKCSAVGSLGNGNTVTLPAQSIATVVINSDGSVSPSPSATASPVVTPTASSTATATPTVTATATPTATATTTTIPTPSATTGCTVSYTQSNWGGGATVNITIKNNGATPINGWNLMWNFANNQKISNLWCGNYTQSGTKVTVTNAPYNNVIAANGSVTFGFNISYSGTNAKPASFTLNGINCQVE